MRPARRALLLGGALGALAPSRARAERAWPDRPVRLVVAFAPGGPADIIARILGDKLSQLWGRAAVVENRGGAGGNVAAQLVARARPDGGAALVTTSAFAVNPSLSRNAGYRPDELTVAALIAATPNLFAVRPDFSARTLAEFVALARRRSLNFGSAGVGTTPHLSAERVFRLLAGVGVQHVPFTGAGPALTAVIGGQVELASVAMPAAVDLVRQGAVRGLAVTSARRAPALPEVPATAELGFPSVDDVTWVALFMPAGTPAAVTAQAHADVAEALRDPAVRARLDAAGFAPMEGGPEEAAAFVAAEVRRWDELVRAVGVSLD